MEFRPLKTSTDTLHRLAHKAAHLLPQMESTLQITPIELFSSGELPVLWSEFRIGAAVPRLLSQNVGFSGPPEVPARLS
jgi:hypothetical protein